MTATLFTQPLLGTSCHTLVSVLRVYKKLLVPTPMIVPSFITVTDVTAALPATGCHGLVIEARVQSPLSMPMPRIGFPHWMRAEQRHHPASEDETVSRSVSASAPRKSLTVRGTFVS